MLVDAVERTPEAVGHGHDLRPVPRRGQHGVVAQQGRVVVVAQQHVALAGVGQQRARGEERWRTPVAEEARLEVTAAHRLDQPVVRGGQLGHVPAQHLRALGVGRTRRLALAQVPPPVGRPGRGEVVDQPSVEATSRRRSTGRSCRARRPPAGRAQDASITSHLFQGRRVQQNVRTSMGDRGAQSAGISTELSRTGQLPAGPSSASTCRETAHGDRRRGRATGPRLASPGGTP